MTDSAEVKAHIKLRFKNRNNYTCVVTRSLQVTKRKSKLEYKALDAALSTLDLQGHKSSASMKCSEVDRIIPENLGVSAAILENVIFVHQEDSNWPMQEGMVLKKKFDDIFESTRYTKALEALSKTKKDYVSKSKDLKAELAEFGAHMTTVQTHKQELLDRLDNQEDINETLTLLAEKIESNEGELKVAQEQVEKAREQMNELQKAQWQVEEAERRVQEKDRNLERRLDAKDDELQRTINNYEATMSSKQQELREHKSQVDNIQSEIERLREEVNKLNAKKGQVELLQEQVRAAKDQQMQMAQSLSKKYTSAPSAGTEFSLQTMKDYQGFLSREVSKSICITIKEIPACMACYH
ncbi:hypothetical protein EON65_07950 [archaeon]|nr:MAG: hypothetical protein EON65_07950 [archaeon]